MVELLLTFVINSPAADFNPIDTRCVASSGIQAWYMDNWSLYGKFSFFFSIQIRICNLDKFALHFVCLNQRGDSTYNQLFNTIRCVSVFRVSGDFALNRNFFKTLASFYIFSCQKWSNFISNWFKHIRWISAASMKFVARLMVQLVLRSNCCSFRFPQLLIYYSWFTNH